MLVVEKENLAHHHSKAAYEADTLNWHSWCSTPSHSCCCQALGLTGLVLGHLQQLWSGWGSQELQLLGQLHMLLLRRFSKFLTFYNNHTLQFLSAKCHFLSARYVIFCLQDVIFSLQDMLYIFIYIYIYIILKVVSTGFQCREFRGFRSCTGIRYSIYTQKCARDILPKC